jgi:Tol biopolymer transport system component
VELPFTIVFEPPSQRELRALLRMRGTWVAGLIVALAIGSLLVALHVSRAEAVASGTSVPLTLSSRPAGATVWLDGRERGRTSLVVPVELGTHTVTLKTQAGLDAQYSVEVGGEGAALDALLWRRQPALMRLRPPIPGTVLSEVRFLENGQLVLSSVVSAGRQLQAWRLEPARGALEPLVTDASGTRLAVAADGQHLAYLGYPIGPPGPGVAVAGRSTELPSVVWIHADGRLAPTGAWRPPLTPGEQLLDASWSPRADGLLTLTGTVLADASMRTRVWYVDGDGRTARELLALPAEVVAGSHVWSPDGRRVVFQARSGAVQALCLLELDGGFRYLADLVDRADQVGSLTAPGLAHPAVAWSADSQWVLFVAPRQRPPGQVASWLQSDPRRALYVASSADVAPVMLGLTDVDRAVWREDGQILGLGRLGTDGALDLRVLGPARGEATRTGEHLLELPLRPGVSYAATWDLGHAQLLIASPASAGGVDYWLAMLGLEGE